MIWIELGMGNMDVTEAYVQGGAEIQVCVSNWFVSSKNIATIWTIS